MGSGGGGSSAKQNEIQQQMNDLAIEQFDYYKEEKVKQQAKLDDQRASFEAFEFKNPFADAKNEFAGLETNFDNLGAEAYKGMENRFEDMTVDMRAADFQTQQGQQQRANILQSLKGSAGTSGVAGLAQSMANQGQLQTQQIAAGIGQQERQNSMLSAQEGSRIDQMQRQATLQGGEVARQMGMGRENLIAQGQGGADRMIMQGEAAVQGAEFGRESTLLASEYGLLAGANNALQGAEGNVMSSLAAEADMYGSRAQAQNANRSNMLNTGMQMLKIYYVCVPEGVKIDGIDNKINIEDIKPGDVVIGYDGNPVKVLQKHEYLEDPTKERFYEVEFNNGSKVNVCDMHKIKCIAAKDITENVLSKKVYGGVKFSYDLLTEDLGYRIDGIPVNSMIAEMAGLITELKNK
tara:strand:- start:4134 stop:5354 length:1221 start_codon:yes stop_codon:yes gene_type:complete